MSDEVPIYPISLPEYRLHPETDWLRIGRKLDRLIEREFPERRLAFRGIGLRDHPGKSLDDLVTVVREIGTDKYDSERQGLYYARDVASDIHAMPCVVTSNGLVAEKQWEKSPLAEFLHLFYEGALADRGYSVRIDLIMLYDLDDLAPLHGLPPEHCYEFSFKCPDDRRRALLGIIKIL